MIKQFTKGLLETILVTYVSASMFIYGAMKFAQFGDNPYSDKLVADLTDMQLMWAFYGRTLIFPLIIGGFEIAGAGLLFFKKTRLLGCLFLSTILINIIIQDFVYSVHGGAIASAIIYQLIIFYILFKYRTEMINAFKSIKLSSDTGFWKWAAQVLIGLLISVAIKLSLGL
jgi:hypothetical protein